MNSSFGLGIVIDLKDNASSGLSTLEQNFNKLDTVTSNLQSDVRQAGADTVTALATSGTALMNVGDDFINAGTGILNMFKNVTAGILDTGGEVWGFKNTLSMLFKSQEEGDKAFEWVSDFAKTSMFNFEDLLPSMTLMKAVGVDIRDEVKSTGGASQNLLHYASDLAAVFPTMRNTYGTGINAMMGAFKEYIAEGNAVTLKRGAGLDITQLLGEDKGETIAERTRQIADLVEQIGALGMSKSLEGTPQQMLANMEDYFYILRNMISDSGVYEMYTEIIAKVADMLASITDEEWQNFATIIANVLLSIMTPLSNLIDYVVIGIGWFRELALTNPQLAETLLKIGAIAGVALVAFGVLLKFAGSIFMLSSGILQFMTMGQGGISIIGLLGKALLGLAPLAAIAGLVYLAWTTNFMNLQAWVAYYSENLDVLFEDVSNIVMGFVDFFVQGFESMQPAIWELLDWVFYLGSIFVDIFESTIYWVVLPVLDNLKVAFLIVSDTIGRIMPLIGYFVEEAVYRIYELFVEQLLPTLSNVVERFGVLIDWSEVAFYYMAESISIAFDIILAAWDTILYPVIEAIMTTIEWLLMPVFELFFEFLIWGFEEAFNLIEYVWLNILEPVFEAIEDVLTNTLLPVFYNTFPYIVDIVRDAFLIIIDIWNRVLFPVIERIARIINEVLLPVFKIVFEIIASVVETAFKIIVTLWNEVLKPVINQLIDFVSNVLLPTFDRVFPVIAQVVTRAFEVIKEIWERVLKPAFLAILSVITDSIMPIWNEAFAVISDVAKWAFDKIAWLVENVLGPAFNFVMDYIVNVIVPAFEKYFPLIQKIVQTAFKFIEFLWFNVLKPTFKLIWSYVSEILWPFFKMYFEFVWGIVKLVFEKIQNIWNNLLKPVFDAIWRLVSETLWPIFKKYFNLIKEHVAESWENIKYVWDTVLSPALGAVWAFITDVLQPAFEVVFDVVSAVVEAAFDAIEWVWLNVLSPVVQTIDEKIGGLEGLFSLSFSVIETVVSAAFTGIQWTWDNVLKPVFDAIGKAIDFVVDKFEKFDKFVKDVKSSPEKLKQMGINVVSENILGNRREPKDPGNFTNANSKGSSGGGGGGAFGDAGLLPNLRRKSGDVSWNADGAVFSKPTLFNTNLGVQGVGEAGPEAVAPIDVLMGFVRQAVAETQAPVLLTNEVTVESPQKEILDTIKQVIESKPKTESVTNDYSVTFSKGSVTIQLADASNRSMEEAAEKLMKIIERKQELKEMALRSNRR